MIIELKQWERVDKPKSLRMAVELKTIYEE